MLIYDVCAALNEANVSYAIVGGYAVALHGVLRGTVDIDVALQWSLKNLETTEAVLKKLGLVSRIPVSSKDVFHFREEYIEKRNLIAWNFYDPINPVRQVDIIINYDLGTRPIKTIRFPLGPVRILSLADLIEMKRKSGRPQDLEDVKALELL